MSIFSGLRSAVGFARTVVSSTGRTVGGAVGHWRGRSTEVANPTAQIEEGIREGILWFDNLYPKKLHPLDFRWIFSKSASERRLQRIVAKENVEITKIIPREKEGGAFVHFRSKYDVNKVEEILVKDLKEHREHSLFVPQEIRTHLVHGNPFIEDMISRYPSSRIRITFQGPEIVQEELFRHFRVYGKINDIIIPPLVKDQPRFAIISFKRYHGGVSARNCMHRSFIDKTELVISYEEILKTGMISDFINKHSKIAIPAIGIIFGTVTYLIFDPIRIFFIQNKITGRFDFMNSSLVQNYFPGLAKSIQTYFGTSFSRHDVKSKWIREDTSSTYSEENVANIQLKLKQLPGSVLFVVGTKGSGKRATALASLTGRKNVLVIDCNYLLSLNNEEFIPQLCRMVGCFPGFTFLKYATLLTDTLLGGGASKGGTSQVAVQIHKVLECLTISLSRITSMVHQRGKSMNDIPVIIIDGARFDNRDKHDKFFDILLEWASFTTENQVAHVIFLTDSSVAVDAQNKVLMGRRSEIMALNDINPDTAIQIALDRFHVSIPPEDRKDLELLGGRISDLFSVLTKARNGVPIHIAVEEEVQNAITIIRTRGLGEGSDRFVLNTNPISKYENVMHSSCVIFSIHRTPAWTKTQLWFIIEQLAEKNEVPYDSILYAPLFKGNDSPITALVSADILIISQESGKQKVLKPARPVYREAFHRMKSDKILCGGIGALMQKQLIEEETAKILKYEDELRQLRSLQGWILNPPGLNDRIAIVESFLKESNDKITKYNKDRVNYDKMKKG